MEGLVSLVISAAALGISLLTAWMTLFQRGTIRMTRPAVIFFGPDELQHHKIFLRALLVSTGQRGRILENMYVMLTHDGRQQPFNIWVYDSTKSVRGSGVFVGETGVEANHHFLLPDGADFAFKEGLHRFEVYAHLLGSERRHLLFSCELSLTNEHERVLTQSNGGLYFDWLPEQARYVPHIDLRPRRAPKLTESPIG